MKFFFSSCLMTLPWLLLSDTLWADTPYKFEPASAISLKAMVITMITFVQGALNGLISLFLRRWRFQNAGRGWLSAFWLGFPIALVWTVLLNWMASPLEVQPESTTSGFASLIMFLSYIGLNLWCVSSISKWAARE